MPNVSATNTNLKPISILGLGKVAPNATKTGYIEEAQFVPYRDAYRTKSYRVGMVLQESGQPMPTGTQAVSADATMAAGTHVALVDTADGDVVYTLVAANSVASGYALTILATDTTNDVTATAAGADNIGAASGTTYTLNTATPRVKLISDGVSRWTLATT